MPRIGSMIVEIALEHLEDILKNYNGRVVSINTLNMSNTGTCCGRRHVQKFKISEKTLPYLESA